jgi:3-vinyl bacteriochlorophyllide hydratase
LDRIIALTDGSVQNKLRQVKLTLSVNQTRLFSVKAPIYTPEQRIRRDQTSWTLVQGVLAPVQFLVFLLSLVLVLRMVASGSGYELANASVLVKTALLYTIMITGCIWEKRVFGQYLFAPAFYWEDMVSMLVMALHTAYLWAWWQQAFAPQAMMVLALVAYGAYLLNATQFVLKLRAARLGGLATGAAS